MGGFSPERAQVPQFQPICDCTGEEQVVGVWSLTAEHRALYTHTHVYTHTHKCTHTHTHIQHTYTHMHRIHIVTLREWFRLEKEKRREREEKKE